MQLELTETRTASERLERATNKRFELQAGSPERGTFRRARQREGIFEDLDVQQPTAAQRLVVGSHPQPFVIRLERTRHRQNGNRKVAVLIRPTI